MVVPSFGGSVPMAGEDTTACRAGLALFQATATASASPPADSAAAAMRGVKRIVFTGHSLTFTNWLFYVSIEEI
jgi:hypothetical protein